MYTYNLFVFGLDLSTNPTIWKIAEDMDFSFTGENEFKVKSHYHGSAKQTPITFGKIITDDDNNPEFINVVRSSKEEDHIEGYKQFVSAFKKHELDAIFSMEKEIEKLTDPKEKIEAFIQIKESKEDLEVFFEFLDNTKPTFHNVQVSS